MKIKKGWPREKIRLRNQHIKEGWKKRRERLGLPVESTKIGIGKQIHAITIIPTIQKIIVMEAEMPHDF